MPNLDEQLANFDEICTPIKFDFNFVVENANSYIVYPNVFKTDTLDIHSIYIQQIIQIPIKLRL